MSVKYYAMIRRDMATYGHLRFRIFGMATFSMFAYFYTSFKRDRLTNTLIKKYLADLSDFEIENFKELTEQKKIRELQVPVNPQNL